MGFEDGRVNAWCRNINILNNVLIFDSLFTTPVLWNHQRCFGGDRYLGLCAFHSFFNVRTRAIHANSRNGGMFDFFVSWYSTFRFIFLVSHLAILTSYVAYVDGTEENILALRAWDRFHAILNLRRFSWYRNRRVNFVYRRAAFLLFWRVFFCDKLVNGNTHLLVTAVSSCVGIL